MVLRDPVVAALQVVQRALVVAVLLVAPRALVVQRRAVHRVVQRREDLLAVLKDLREKALQINQVDRLLAELFSKLNRLQKDL